MKITLEKRHLFIALSAAIPQIIFWLNVFFSNGGAHDAFFIYLLLTNSLVAMVGTVVVDIVIDQKVQFVLLGIRPTLLLVGIADVLSWCLWTAIYQHPLGFYPNAGILL